MRKLIALLLLSSCISTTEVREDYEGRWHSDYLPFGNLASEVVIDMHDGHTDVEVDHEHAGGGDYFITEDGVVFGWSIEVAGIEMQFLDAFVSHDEMLLRWKPYHFLYPYTTIYERE